MSEATLLKSFDLLATAPDGVTRLRELILTLAVQGKLVLQDPKDEPASALLTKIRAEKDRLISEGTIKRDKPLPEIAEEEMHYGLPAGWAWTRLNDLAYPQAGFAFKSSGFNEVRQGLPLIRIRDVGSDNPSTFFSGEYREEFIVEPGDWLISMDGEFRVRVWVGPKALLNQRVTRLMFYGDDLFQPFITSALQFRLNELQGTKAYTTVDHLSGGQIASSVVALPPLAEQARIVARVEELMKLSDALEEKGRLADEQHTRLTSTLFEALANSESAHALAENWKLVAEHFDLLLDRPEAVDALEKAILQLAVRGLLVPQDPKDEPASELIKKIRAEKDRLIAEGKINRDKPLLPISEEERRFDLPSGWSWVRLEQISQVIVDCPHSTPRFVARGRLCLDTNSFKQGRLIPHKLRYVDDDTFSERIVRLAPKPGDLVFAREGLVGESIIIPEGVEACLGQRVMLFRFSRNVSSEFVRLVLSSAEFLELLLSLHKGIGAKHVNVGDLRLALVPLPSFAEQSRIVKKVESLRRMCADLRQRLIVAREKQVQLVQALVEQPSTATT